MCLKIDNDATQKLERKFDNKSEIVAYKLCKIVNSKFRKYLNHFSDQIVTGFCRQNFNYYPGINESDRNQTGLTDQEKQEQFVFHGIHVFLDKEVMKDIDKLFLGGYHDVALLPVVCSKSDFVKAGTSKFFGRPEAVFTKVWIDEKDYNKATNDVSQ